MKAHTIAKLTVALAVAIAASAHDGHAVGLNPDGVGQVLIYPYYTVNGGNSTLLSVVNTNDLGKLLKMRFLEAYNGQNVLDFQIFLAAYDVWTANLFALTDTDGTNLLTDDESCTLPDINNATGLPQLPDGRSYVPFRSGQYQTDGGPRTIDRTREGYVTLFELASVKPGSALEAAISHVNGVPPGCSGLGSLTSASPDLSGPTGGLYGSASIVNPALGTVIGYNADALDSFYLLDNNLATSNGSESPFLTDARTTSLGAEAYTYAATGAEGPNRLITSSYSNTNAIDAVSAVFTASVLTNEYVIEAVSASESEWVITFPTKRYYVNTTPAIAPFVQRFAAPGKSCVVVSYRFGSRDGGVVDKPEDCPFCPPSSPPPLMCLETQVLTFQKAEDFAAAGGVSAVLGSRRTVNVDPRGLGGFSSGWMQMDLSPSVNVTEPHALRPSIEGNVFHGLPVTGFLATNYLNRNNGALGVLANYSVGARHRILHECTNEESGGSGFCS